mgnify:FL=1
MKLKKCAAALLVSSCLLTGCSSSAKKVDSKYVVASLSKGNKTKNIFADDLYKDVLDSSSKNSTVFNAVLQNLIDKKFPVNEDMEEDADTIISQIKSYYKNQYGDNYKSTLNQQLKSAGYTNMKQYREKMIKQIQYANFLLDYIDDNFDDVFNDYYQQCSPKYVSLIKISVSDTSSLTDDENSKINEVKELINNTDKSFGDIAQDYSNDSTTSKKKGSIGIVDTKDTAGISDSYGENVFNAINSLSEGQVSDAIAGTDGYYFVKVTNTNKKALKKELKKTDIDSPLLAYDDYLQYVVYDSYKVTYKDKSIKKIPWSRKHCSLPSRTVSLHR